MSQYPEHDARLTQEAISFPIVITLAKNKSIVKPHYHQFYEISYYLSGEATDWVNGYTTNSVRGSVVCKPPNSIHETKSPPGKSYTKYNLMFSLDFLLESGLDSELGKYFTSPGSSGSGLFYHLNDHQINDLNPLFLDIWNDYNGDFIFRQSFIRTKLVEILIFLARSSNDSKDREISSNYDQNRLSAHSHNKIAQILQYIHQHFLENLSLQFLAIKFHTSESYISRAIKLSTGMNFTVYLHELRIEHACSLLVSTRMNVLAVAEESGYNSFKTFSRVFSRLKRMTPTQYRSQHS
jgi:AraC-like DNA-binding protein